MERDVHALVGGWEDGAILLVHCVAFDAYVGFASFFFYSAPVAMAIVTRCASCANCDNGPGPRTARRLQSSSVYRVFLPSFVRFFLVSFVGPRSTGFDLVFYRVLLGFLFHFRNH